MSDFDSEDESGDDLFETDDDEEDDDRAASNEEVDDGEDLRVEDAEAEVEAESTEGSDEVEIIRVERQPVAPIDEEGDGSDDFQTPKKRRKIRHGDKKSDDEDKTSEMNDSFDTSESCPICFESWTNSGDHRLASLACGHLFGYGCIWKWLMGPGKSCPQCNAPAKKRDIRVIYAKRLQTIDTAELDRLRSELAAERRLRLTAEKEAASYRLQAALVSEECSRMRGQLDTLQNGSGGSQLPLGSALGASAAPNSVISSISASYVHVATVRLADGACRVMTACEYMNTLCIAQASPNPLFRGYGIRKLHLLDQHMDRFLVLHSQPIRDLALHPDMQDGLLLSVSMDKTAKLVSLFTGQVVQTYSCPLPVWSCCWHRDCHFQFFAGLSNGQVLLFDTRRTAAPVATLNLAASLTPVCALQYAPRATGGAGDSATSFRNGGLFVGQLDRVSFLAEAPSTDAAEPPPPPLSASAASLQPHPVTPGFRVHSLPLEGSLVSLSFEARTRHLLASFRPSRCQASLASVRHLVCQMGSQGLGAEAQVSCNVMHTLTAGRCLQRMTRSRLYNGPGGALMAASGDEESGATLVWDAGQAQRSQQLSGSGATVLDVVPFDTNAGGHGLVSLSESAVQFFRWNAPS